MRMSPKHLATHKGAGGKAVPRPLVHLELRTGDMPAASAFYTSLLAWRPEWIETRAGCYLAVDTGSEVGGGIALCTAAPPRWLPYAQVDRIDEATDRARRLGAVVAVEPREGPAGWRSVVSTPCGAEIGLWQPKEWR
jgi:predicted enzyme related to lactoylglutathione lyase